MQFLTTHRSQTEYSHRKALSARFQPRLDHWAVGRLAIVIVEFTPLIYA